MCSCNGRIGTNFDKWSVRRFLTKRDNRVFSSGLWRALRTHSKHKECRRKAPFPPSLKRLVEHLHKDGGSFRQKTTQRPGMKEELGDPDRPDTLPRFPQQSHSR